MAISSINPVQNSVIAPGDEFSFLIDPTYTALVIKVAQSGGDEYAYDHALGGVQAGYTVVIQDLVTKHGVYVRRDAGWNKEPTVISVTENETGTSTTTSFSYYLTATAIYPEGMQPYSDQYDGSLIVTEENVTVRNDVGWIDYKGTDFVVTDMGSGKVRVELDPAISGSDTDAIHDNVAGEINAITAKGTPTGSDVIIIEDAADSFNKKKVLITNLPGTGGGGSGSYGNISLGSYDGYLQTGSDWPATQGTFEIDDNPSLYGNLRFNYQNKAGTNLDALFGNWTGGTIILVDASGDKAYFVADTDWFYYSQKGGDTWTCWCNSLYSDPGFSWTGGGVNEYEVFFSYVGPDTLFGAPLKHVTDLSMTPPDGAAPVYNDYTNQIEARKAVYSTTVDPGFGNNDQTFGHWEGRLWVNTVAGNLFVCTDNFTGEWLQIVQNTAQYYVGNYTYDSTAGIPNANGEAQPNHATYASVTSVNYYVNDAAGDDASAILLSLQAGSLIEVYHFESWKDAWTVTGDPTDNGTYITVPVEPMTWNPGAWPQTPEGGHRLTTQAGTVNTDGTEAQNAALLRTQNTEVNASAATLGELWFQAATGAGDEYLKFTDSAGTRFALIPHIAAGAPGAGNDVDDGHEIGQIWVDTSLNDAYICCDNTSAAASWKIIAT